MMVQKRAQTSLEYIMIMGLIGFVIMSSLFLMQTYSLNSTDAVVLEQMDRLGVSIVKNARVLGTFGHPSRNIMDYSFPQSIINISSEDSHTLIITAQLRNGINYLGYYSETPLNITMYPEDLYEGKKKFLFRTQNGTDAITITRWRNS